MTIEWWWLADRLVFILEGEADYYVDGVAHRMGPRDLMLVGRDVLSLCTRAQNPDMVPDPAGLVPRGTPLVSVAVPVCPGAVAW